MQRLLRRFAHAEPLTADDFLRDYGDSRFGRFFLYLLVYRNKAQDWDEHGHRIGFEGASLLSDFRPQWHHIFPKKYLDGKVDEPLIDALANIAVIGPEINIRISAKDPLSYIAKYRITRDKLAQQFVESASLSICTMDTKSGSGAGPRRSPMRATGFSQSWRGLTNSRGHCARPSLDERVVKYAPSRANIGQMSFSGEYCVQGGVSS